MGVFRGASEYRSALFYTTPEQKEIAEKVTAEVQEKQYVRDRPLCTVFFFLFHFANSSKPVSNSLCFTMTITITFTIATTASKADLSSPSSPPSVNGTMPKGTTRITCSITRVGISVLRIGCIGRGSAMAGVDDSV